MGGDERESASNGVSSRDSCFYLRNVTRVKGKRTIDLKKDPPPDLIVEVDIESSSIHTMSIYARVGVPEVWRYDGERVRIHILADDRYDESESSLASLF